MQVILASKSPRRREILEKHGFKVLVQKPSNVWELDLGEEGFDTPEKVVCENARLKVLSIIPKEHTWVVGSDTIVMLHGKQYGKPKNEEQALQFLTELSGHTHEVYSSYCLKMNGRMELGFDVSQVTFKNLSRREIEAYIQNVHVMDKAGAYAVQEGGEDIVASLQGSFYTVMGLPIEKILAILTPSSHE